VNTLHIKYGNTSVAVVDKEPESPTALVIFAALGRDAIDARRNLLNARCESMYGPIGEMFKGDDEAVSR